MGAEGKRQRPAARYTEQIVVMVEPEIAEAVRAQAERDGASVAEVVRRHLRIAISR
jgi:hypothetical protein